MHHSTHKRLIPVIGCALSFHVLAANERQNLSILDPYVLTANPVANSTPTTTFESPVSSLTYSPWVDVQARNLNELQGDIAVRGGTFENTGFIIGGLPIMDPQTGHYAAELPISSRMLADPEVALGSAQTRKGFNASVASISLDFASAQSAFSHRIFAGSDALFGFDLYGAQAFGASGWAGEYSIAYSENNQEDFGADHQFERIMGRVEWVDEDSRFNFMVGHQDKEFTWPYLYALRELHDLVGSSGIEGEDVETTLLLATYERQSGDINWEIGAAYRQNLDDYEFDVAQPGLFNAFEHDTDYAVARIAAAAPLWNGQWTTSALVAYDAIKSTALVFGEFDDRTYTALTTDWSGTVHESGRTRHSASFGLRLDDTNRDSTAVSPFARYSIDVERNAGIWTAFLDLSQSTQVAGYTAIAGNPNGGLFRGNQNLDREFARSAEIGLGFDGEGYAIRSQLFFRQDDNLVDWTYQSGSLFARKAENLDLETWGAELFAEVNTAWYRLTFAYTWLDKSPDYGSVSDLVDASFYALNYAEHRVTLGAVVSLTDAIELSWDNEWRAQEPNSLRSSDNTAWLSHLSLSATTLDSRLRFQLSIDNLLDEDFEEVPGAPGQGRQASFSVWMSY